jgi:hypothetical protein
MRSLPTRSSFSGEHKPRTLNIDHHFEHCLRLPCPLDPLSEARRLNVHVNHHFVLRLQLPHPLDPLREARRLNVDHHLAHRLHLQTHRCQKTQTMMNWRGLALCPLVAYHLSFWLINAQLLTLPTVIANPSIHLNKRSSNATKLSKRPPLRTLHPLQPVGIPGPAKSHFACQQDQNRLSSPYHRSSLTGGSSVPASQALHRNTLIFLSPAVVSSLVAMISSPVPSHTFPSPHLFAMPL